MVAPFPEVQLLHVGVLAPDMRQSPEVEVVTDETTEDEPLYNTLLVLALERVVRVIFPDETVNPPEEEMSPEVESAPEVFTVNCPVEPTLRREVGLLLPIATFPLFARYRLDPADTPPGVKEIFPVVFPPMVRV